MRNILVFFLIALILCVIAFQLTTSTENFSECSTFTCPADKKPHKVTCKVTDNTFSGCCADGEYFACDAAGTSATCSTCPDPPAYSGSAHDLSTNDENVRSANIGYDGVTSGVMYTKQVNHLKTGTEIPIESPISSLKDALEECTDDSDCKYLVETDTQYILLSAETRNYVNGNISSYTKSNVDTTMAACRATCVEPNTTYGNYDAGTSQYLLNDGATSFSCPMYYKLSPVPGGGEGAPEVFTGDTSYTASDECGTGGAGNMFTPGTVGAANEAVNGTICCADTNKFPRRSVAFTPPTMNNPSKPPIEITPGAQYMSNRGWIFREILDTKYIGGYFYQLPNEGGGINPTLVCSTTAADITVIDQYHPDCPRDGEGVNVSDQLAADATWTELATAILYGDDMLSSGHWTRAERKTRAFIKTFPIGTHTSILPHVSYKLVVLATQPSGSGGTWACCSSNQYNANGTCMTCPAISYNALLTNMADGDAHHPNGSYEYDNIRTACVLQDASTTLSGACGATDFNDVYNNDTLKLDNTFAVYSSPQCTKEIYPLSENGSNVTYTTARTVNAFDNVTEVIAGSGVNLANLASKKSEPNPLFNTKTLFIDSDNAGDTSTIFPYDDDTTFDFAYITQEDAEDAHDDMQAKGDLILCNTNKYARRVVSETTTYNYYQKYTERNPKNLICCPADKYARYNGGGSSPTCESTFAHYQIADDDLIPKAKTSGCPDGYGKWSGNNKCDKCDQGYDGGRGHHDKYRTIAAAASAVAAGTATDPDVCLTASAGIFSFDGRFADINTTDLSPTDILILANGSYRDNIVLYDPSTRTLTSRSLSGDLTAPICTGNQTAFINNRDGYKICTVGANTDTFLVKVDITVTPTTLFFLNKEDLTPFDTNVAPNYEDAQNVDLRAKVILRTKPSAPGGANQASVFGDSGYTTKVVKPNQAVIEDGKNPNYISTCTGNKIRSSSQDHFIDSAPYTISCVRCGAASNVNSDTGVCEVVSGCETDGSSTNDVYAYTTTGTNADDWGCYTVRAHRYINAGGYQTDCPFTNPIRLATDTVYTNETELNIDQCDPVNTDQGTQLVQGLPSGYRLCTRNHQRSPADARNCVRCKPHKYREPDSYDGCLTCPTSTYRSTLTSTSCDANLTNNQCINETYDNLSNCDYHWHRTGRGQACGQCIECGADEYFDEATDACETLSFLHDRNSGANGETLASCTYSDHTKTIDGLTLKYRVNDTAMLVGHAFSEHSSHLFYGNGTFDLPGDSFADRFNNNVWEPDPAVRPPVSTTITPNLDPTTCNKKQCAGFGIQPSNNPTDPTICDPKTAPLYNVKTHWDYMSDKSDSYPNNRDPLDTNGTDYIHHARGRFDEWGTSLTDCFDKCKAHPYCQVVMFSHSIGPHESAASGHDIVPRHYAFARDFLDPSFAPYTDSYENAQCFLLTNLNTHNSPPRHAPSGSGRPTIDWQPSGNRNVKLGTLHRHYFRLNDAGWLDKGNHYSCDGGYIRTLKEKVQYRFAYTIRRLPGRHHEAGSGSKGPMEWVNFYVFEGLSSYIPKETLVDDANGTLRFNYPHRTSAGTPWQNTYNTRNGQTKMQIHMKDYRRTVADDDIPDSDTSFDNLIDKWGGGRGMEGKGRMYSWKLHPTGQECFVMVHRTVNGRTQSVVRVIPLEYWEYLADSIRLPTSNEKKRQHPDPDNPVGAEIYKFEVWFPCMSTSIADQAKSLPSNLNSFKIRQLRSGERSESWIQEPTLLNIPATGSSDDVMFGRYYVATKIEDGGFIRAQRTVHDNSLYREGAARLVIPTKWQQSPLQSASYNYYDYCYILIEGRSLGQSRQYDEDIRELFAGGACQYWDLGYRASLYE